MNKLKLAVMVLMAVAVVGCASVDGVVKATANNSYKLPNDGSGIIYGAWVTDLEDVNKVCASISKSGISDDRCKHQSDYDTGGVAGAFGYAAGFVGAVAIAPKSLGLKPCTTGSSSCYYVKAKVEQGKIATVLEVVSAPGENKCHWGGMPRAGGTVCDSVGWSYRKDLNY